MQCLVCLERSRLVKGTPSRPLVWKCGDCGFEWVDRNALASVFAPPDYQEYPYNERIDQWFERMQPFYRRGFGARLKRTIGLGALGDKSFLDIGCANGEYLRVASCVGFGRVAGVEIDTGAVERARRFGRIWQDTSSIEGWFDIIQIKNVLSNILDFQFFLKQSVSHLNSDGFLYLDLLNEQSLTALARKLFMDERKLGQKNQRFGHLRPPYVINGFTLKSMQRMLDNLGLAIRYAENTYCGSIQVPYSSTFITKLTGFAGSLFGRGPMLVVEAAYKKQG